jgi:peptidoglycan/xylan/chitin deacetylase (PgdA/CDA1 family)
MRWKNDAKCAVMLTHDVDGKHRWLGRARGGNEDFANPMLVEIGEYGPRVGLPRILELHDQYDLPAGFYVPGMVAEDHPEKIREIHAAGHEIGFHGHTHRGLAGLSDDQLANEFERANEIFEDLIGETPVGSRQWVNDRIVDWLIDLDFEYETTLAGHDLPYVLESEQGEILELPHHYNTDDAAFFAFLLSPSLAHQSGIDSPWKVLELWKTEFDVCYERGLLFNLVCHPQIIGRPNRIAIYEELLKYIAGHSDVWIARPREIARYWRKEHLEDSFRVNLEVEY